MQNAECKMQNAEQSSFSNSTERRLFGDGRFFHSDGKARFLFEQPRECPERPDAEYPFILLTGRGSSAQWHTETRTKKSDVLRQLSPRQLFVEIHPQDARRFGIRHHSQVRVRSRRGELVAQAVVTATQPQGQVFLPMHDSATNRLTFPAFDPYSRQPAYKYCAVRIELANNRNRHRGTSMQ
jgi:assimilatory nitrate reductase catalytic subunit